MQSLGEKFGFAKRLLGTTPPTSNAPRGIERMVKNAIDKSTQHPLTPFDLVRIPWEGTFQGFTVFSDSSLNAGLWRMAMARLSQILDLDPFDRPVNFKLNKQNPTCEDLMSAEQALLKTFESCTGMAAWPATDRKACLDRTDRCRVV